MTTKYLLFSYLYVIYNFCLLNEFLEKKKTSPGEILRKVFYELLYCQQNILLRLSFELVIYTFRDTIRYSNKKSNKVLSLNKVFYK